MSCLIAEWLIGQNLRLRERDPHSTMADSEVLTIELIGALLGIGTDKETYMDAKLIQKYEEPPYKLGYFFG